MAIEHLREGSGSAAVETVLDQAAGFNFSTASLERRLEVLLHLIDHAQGAILVVGERYSGKGALRKRLLVGTTERWDVVQLHANAMLDPRSLLHDIAQGLGATPRGSDRKSYLEAIEAALVGYRGHELLPILFVDDAHELPAEGLRLLFALAQPKAARIPLRVLLFCEPQIRTVLDAPELQALQSQLGHVIDLPPLSLEETRAYLEARLPHIGLEGLLPLPQTLVQRIHTESKGLPGRIDELARDKLTGTDSLSGDRPTGPGVTRWNRWRLYTCAALLAAVTLYIALGPIPDTAPHLPDGGIIPLELPGAVPTDSDLPGQEQASPEPGVELAEDTRDALEPDRPLTTESPAEPTPVPQPLPARPEPPPKPPEPARPEVAGHTDPWLSAQRSDHYVVQLFASQNPTAVARFLRQTGLPPRARSVSSYRDGKTWQLVVYGPFPNRRSAMASMASLSPTLRAHKPWIRPLRDLQRSTPAGP